jgi:hypothetical protein
MEGKRRRWYSRRVCESGEIRKRGKIPVMQCNINHSFFSSLSSPCPPILFCTESLMGKENLIHFSNSLPEMKMRKDSFRRYGRGKGRGK